MRSGRLGLYLVLALGAVAMVVPFVWMLSSSLKTDAEIFRYPPRWIPEVIRWQNYPEAMARAPFARYFLNSGVVAGLATFVGVLLSSMAGYAFARLQFPGKRVLFGLIVATLMIPFYVTLIPLFVFVTRFPLAGGNDLLGAGGQGLYNTYAGLIVPGLANVFGIFLMRQYFQTLPSDLEDAARIDGAGEFTVFWRVMLPLTGPAVATLAVFLFTSEWNAYLWPLVVTGSEPMRTVQLGLALFKGEFQTDWARLMAATVVVTLPVIGIFLAAQRWFINSIAFSGLKD